jgi:uncharacterized membrane protein
VRGIFRRILVRFLQLIGGLSLLYAIWFSVLVIDQGVAVAFEKLLTAARSELVALASICAIIAILTIIRERFSRKGSRGQILGDVGENTVYPLISASTPDVHFRPLSATTARRMSLSRFDGISAVITCP